MTIAELIGHALSWWRGGDALMPVISLVALVLYAILAERTLVLFGARRRDRGEELRALLTGDDARRAWLARYLALAEAEALSRGFALARALTAALPLLGLLGTVSGMIDTFANLGGPGQRVAQHASAGISLALTATQYGMALAIPAVAWSWLLQQRVTALVAHRDQVMRESPAARRPELPELPAALVGA
jgi:biopolymer transport protein ExbB